MEHIFSKYTKLPLIKTVKGFFWINGLNIFETIHWIISDKIFNRDRLPKDENEKNVPSKKKIIEEITKEILSTIDADFHKLP